MNWVTRQIDSKYHTTCPVCQSAVSVIPDEYYLDELKIEKLRAVLPSFIFNRLGLDIDNHVNRRNLKTQYWIFKTLLHCSLQIVSAITLLLLCLIMWIAVMLIISIPLGEVFFCDIELLNSFCPIKNYTTMNCYEKRDGLIDIVFEVYRKIEDRTLETNRTILSGLPEDVALDACMKLAGFDVIYHLLHYSFEVIDEIERQCKKRTN
jgi:hypothetical protein